jgi:hypothetical protein
VQAIKSFAFAFLAGIIAFSVLAAIMFFILIPFFQTI